ncbi:MAG: sigma-70 family RNA polymerase sigma factor [Candidatus Latescibacteria bacterium]|nr:sigma-70 family RNA polymerase sigma factor [Candidatus Latescibacterota bacterium]
MTLYKEYYENDDNIALKKLLKHYRDWGYWFFKYNFGFDYDETDEIIQNTFISVIGEKRYNPVGDATLDTFFQVCAVRRAIAYLRSIRRFVEYDKTLIESIEDPTLPPYSSKIDEELLWIAINSVVFANNQKNILIDKYIVELSNADMAIKYTMTPHSISTRSGEAKNLIRAQQRIMEMLRVAEGSLPYDFKEEEND